MSHSLTRNRRYRRAPAWLLLPMVLLLAGVRGCPEKEGTLYPLVPGSLLLEGCIEGPCLCPVWASELLGSFRLHELPIFAPGPTRFFAVSDVHWKAGDTHVRGAGHYQQDPVNRTQRMRLRLRIDGTAPVEFDSGLVDVSVPLPELAVRLRQNGEGACFDVIFDLRALPLGAPPRRCREEAECGAGAFCQTPEGRCDEAGQCVRRPEACTLHVDPVCGCDGRTWNNACEAAAAGVSVGSREACPG